MPVEFYQFGVKVGGASGGGGGGGISGPPEQFSGNLPIGDTTITFSTTTVNLTIYNEDDTDSFQVSYDGGVTFKIIGPYGTESEPVAVDSIVLRATVAGVAYSVIAILST